MKLVALGDTHGTPYWMDILKVEKPDKVVFIGDYFDGYSDKLDEVGNFQSIIEYKKMELAEVILLVGNHDHHYFPEVGCTGTSRYQYKKASKLQGLIHKNREHFKMAYRDGDLLFTHSGVTNSFMNRTFGAGEWDVNNVANLLNEKFKEDANAFCFYGDDPYGDDITQTPIWVRPPSLLQDAIPELTQVVGHTIVESITKTSNVYFIDTMQTSQQYLVYENGDVVVKQIVNLAKN